MICRYFLLVILCCDSSWSFLTSDGIHRAVAGSTLRFAAVVLRHGTRSPTGSFPLNLLPPNDMHFWPNGKGELTQVGIMESFTLGKMLRKRYGHLLSSRFESNEILIKYCERYGRDYWSAVCATAGLYPEENFLEDCRENKSSNFEVHPTNFDIVELFVTSDCPYYRKVIFGWALNHLSYQRWDKELLEHISNQTGIENINGIDLYFIFDVLQSQLQNGYKLPKWSYKIYPEPMKSFSDKFLIAASGGWGQETLLRLGAGPELKNILNLMVDNAKGSQTSKKFYLEAAHDITILNLLISMGYDDPHLESNPGSYLAFELHQINQDYIIKVYFFRSPFEVSSEYIPIRTCSSEPCTLDAFARFVNNLNPQDWHGECNKKL